MLSALEEKDVIRETIARYCMYFDGGEWEKWLDLFTDDVVIDERPKLKVYNGKDRLLELVAEVPKIFEMAGDMPLIKHCGVNIVIDLEGDEATAYMTMLAFRTKGDGRIITRMAGREEWRFVKERDRWLIRLKKVYFDMFGDMPD